MNLFQKIKSKFKDDVCEGCGGKCTETFKQLYMLDQTVGHYARYENPSYYKKNLYKVEKKTDIPSGVYACGITEYTCQECHKKLVKLSIFLPVRDQEMHETPVYYRNGEMDDFIR